MADSTDCDDGDEDTNPDADEVCDTKDNDCDEEIDEKQSMLTLGIRTRMPMDTVMPMPVRLRNPDQTSGRK